MTAIIKPQEPFNVKFPTSSIISVDSGPVSFIPNDLSMLKHTWLQFDVGTGFLSGDAPSRGLFSFKFTILNTCSAINITLNLEVQNDPPIISTPVSPILLTAGEYFAYTIPILDPNDDPLQVVITQEDSSGMPSWI